MKKIIFLFLLIMSFQIFSEGKYTEAAKKATEITNEELKDRTEAVLYCSKKQSLFDGIDVDKILKESVERVNRKLGVDIYLNEMNTLRQEMKFENLYFEGKISYDEKIDLERGLRDLEELKELERKGIK